MAIIPWEQQLATIVGQTSGTGLRIYQSHEQPRTGKMIAIYGRPGVGKTDLVAALAECKYALPLVYLNIEGGAWVFSHRKDITIIDIAEYTDFTTLMARFSQAQSLPFRTLAVDNGSELQAQNILNIVNQRGTMGIKGSGMPSQPNYGASTAQMLNMFRLCHDMSRKFGVTFVFVAWEDARKDSITNMIMRSGIGFTPAVARAVPYIFDIVGHLTVKDDAPQYTRVLNFATNPHSDAKFRRNREEIAQQIPLTTAYTMQQQPLVDVFNTLFGGEKWPSAKYAALSSKATVSYTTTSVVNVSAEEAVGVVEDIVAAKLTESPPQSQ